MTTATKTRKPDGFVHSALGMIETAGKQIAKFAKEADKKFAKSRATPKSRTSKKAS